MDLLPANTVGSCRNCGETLPDGAFFCPKCSQKVSDGRVPLRELWYDFIESFLNFDAKIFRTIRDLFIPGKLTIEYFKGRHISYIPPVRIFLMMAVFHFAILGFSGFDGVNFNFTENKGDLRRAAYQLEFMEKLDSARQVVNKKFKQDLKIERAMDSLLQQFKGIKPDSIEFGYLDFHRDFKIQGKQIHLDERELYAPFDEITKKYKIHGFLEQLQVRQILRLITEKANFSTFLLSKLIWMVLLMMPALALVLKLLYIRRRRYFVEHLVFSFHYHAFAFFLLSIAILINNTGWFSDPKKGESGLPIGIAFLAVIIYLFIAMYRIYQQRFWKTFIKFNILNFSYILIFTVFFVLTMVITVLIF